MVGSDPSLCLHTDFSSIKQKAKSFLAVAGQQGSETPITYYYRQTHHHPVLCSAEGTVGTEESGSTKNCGAEHSVSLGRGETPLFLLSL